MSNNPADRLSELYQLACTTAQGAADILLKHRSHFEISGDTDSPVTSADLAANHHILSNLQEHLGTDDYGYLSEETFTNQNPDDRRKDWVWIIDPLDGTKDYIQNTGDYAVQIALTYQGRPVIAAVACPAQGKLYSALLGSGTWVEDNTGNRRQVRVSSRSKRSEMTIITDLYLSISGDTAPKDWDFAAPELILTEAGGKLTYFDGGLILYNREDVNQWNGIVASNGICHEEICNLLNPTTQQ